MLKAKLLDDLNPDTIYRRNLEFHHYNDSNYQHGMMSVHALWNLTGVLDEEKILCKKFDIAIDNSPKKVHGKLHFLSLAFCSFFSYNLGI